MNNLLNYIFPPKCIFCNNVGSTFCRSCLEECKLLKSVTSKIENHEGSAKLISIYEYAGLVRECIKTSKYGSRQFSALKILATTATLYLKNLGLKVNTYTVVPIPASKQKLSSRGFNQAELIAQTFSKIFKLPMNKSILSRVVDTQHQYGLKKRERTENLKDAFKVTADVTGKNILLVDDICTSGATFLEASSVLKKAGAKNIVCLALSRKLL